MSATDVTSLELATPPGCVERVSTDDLGPVEDLDVEVSYQPAEFPGRLRRQRVQHFFQVVPEEGRGTTALGNTATSRREWVRNISQGAMCQRCPVPESLSSRLCPVPRAIESADLCLAPARQAVDVGVARPTSESTYGNIVPHVRGAPTRHCPFGGESWRQPTRFPVRHPVHAPLSGTNEIPSPLRLTGFVT